MGLYTISSGRCLLTNGNTVSGGFSIVMVVFRTIVVLFLVFACVTTGLDVLKDLCERGR